MSPYLTLSGNRAVQVSVSGSTSHGSDALERLRLSEAPQVGLSLGTGCRRSRT